MPAISLAIVENFDFDLPKSGYRSKFFEIFEPKCRSSMDFNLDPTHFAVAVAVGTIVAVVAGPSVADADRKEKQVKFT